MAEVKMVAQTHEHVQRELPRGLLEYQELLHSGAPGKHLFVALLGLEAFDTPSLVKRLSQGLSFEAFESLRRVIDLATREMAELVDISPRTLTRRRKRGRLERDESDRLVRISRVLAQAIELFDGDVDGARAWLARPQTALGGASSLELLRTDVGTREVEALIGRLEHGVFS